MRFGGGGDGKNENEERWFKDPLVLRAVRLVWVMEPSGIRKTTTEIFKELNREAQKGKDKEQNNTFQFSSKSG